MMYLFLMLAVGTCVLISKRELSAHSLVSPLSLFLGGMLVSSTFAVLGMASWNDQFNVRLAGMVVILGTLAFAAACVFVDKLLARRAGRFEERHPSGNDLEKYKSQNATIIKYVILITILAAALIARVIDTYRIAGELGISSNEDYFTISEIVRGMTASFAKTGSGSLGYEFSYLVKQFDKIVVAFGFASSYLLARSFEKKEDRPYKLMPFLCLAIACVYQLASNSRSGLFWFAVSGGCSYYLNVVRTDERSNWRLSKKCFAVLVLAAGVACFALYLLGSLFGRGSFNGFLDYVTYYFGSGIPAFQKLLESNGPNNGIMGGYTFNTCLSFINKFIKIDNLPGYSIAWVDVGGNLTNTFTAFSRYYLDYGLIGVILLSATSGGIMTLLYRECIYRRSDGLALLYCCISPFVFDMAREEYFFSRLISPNQIILLMIAVMALKFIDSPFTFRGVRLRKKID